MDTTGTSAAAVSMLLEMTSPLVQDDLLADSAFRDTYGLSSAVMLSFAGGEVSVSRSELYSAIRAVLSGRTGVAVLDTKKRKWDLLLEPSRACVPTLVVAHGDRRIVLAQYRLLSPVASTRIHVLDEIIEDVRLSTHERWMQLASDRAFTDNEMDEFDDDVRDTPASVARLIRQEIAHGQVSVATVVPTRPRYYARLVGRYDAAALISDHCSERTAGLLRNLCAWRPPHGVLEALMLSCSKIAIRCIDIESLDHSVITRLFTYFDEHGDRLSQTGAVELALRVLPKFPHIERHILSMVRQIRDDDDDSGESDYGLIVGLFRVIDGELARRGTLACSRPYYRRFAALVQSTVVAREVRAGRIERSGFMKWLWRLPNTRYLLQNYVDMRLEPRWSPVLFDAQGLKSACIGRIMASVDECVENLQSDSLHDVLLEGGDGSVFELFRLSVACLPTYPGPLSAGADSFGPMPDGLRNVVEQRIGAGEIDRESLTLFAHCATMFGLGKDHAGQVAESLKSNRHRITGIEDRSQMVDVVMRLAVAAAVCRSEALADEVRIVVRRHRGHNALFLNMFESILVCLSSGASRAGLQEWAEYVGDWLTELAFLDLKEGEAVALGSALRCLMEIVPELWRTCARADAALQVQVGR